MFKKPVIFFLVCFILFVFLGCNSEQSTEDYVIKYNLNSEPTGLDPQVASDLSAKIVIRNLFEGLTKLDSAGNVLPAVAESWTSSKNDTVFTFNLRRDACWANKDKSPVTATDFVFALERAVSPATKSEIAKTLYCIKNAKDINQKSKNLKLGVTALDDYTLQINLEYPYKNFPSVMASTVAMPCNKTFFNKCNGQYGLEGEKVLGNGSFTLTNIYSWSHNETISLSKNDAYAGLYPSIYTGINFTIGATYINYIKAINNEELDAAVIVDDDAELSEQTNIQTTEIEDTCLGLYFNLKDDILKNKYIRFALLNSLNRNNLLKNLSSDYSIANDIILPTITVADENYRTLAGNNFGLSQSKNYKYNLNIGLQELNLDNLPAINIICLDNKSSRLIADNTIEILNQKLNTYFNIEPLSEDDFEERLALGTFQVALYPLKSSENAPYDMLSHFYSKSKNSFSGLKSQEYDMLIDNISDNIGTDIVPYCVKAEKFLNDNAIFYPICYEKSYFIASNKVTNLIYLPFSGGIDFSGSVNTVQ